MRLNPILFSIGLTGLALTTACTWQDAYDIAQSPWRNRCPFISDMLARQQCMKESAMSYDAYESERQKLRP